MAEEIKVPSLGESVTEAKIAAILKQEGTIVSENEELIELETEKVNQVLYSPVSGTLHWKIKEGDTVKIGDVIGSIEKSEKKAAPKKEAPKKEVKAASPPPPPSPPPAREKEEPVRITGRETRRKMSKMRQAIAERLVESMRTSAMLTTFNEVDMSAIMETRGRYKESFQEKYGVKLGLMSFFVKAVVEALKGSSDLNSYIDGDEIVHREYYDIGVAVGGARGGLVVPVVRNCDTLTFSQIEKEISDLATRAKEGRISVDDIVGGGFTITNGGIYGSLLSTPILNPPQSGILGMHNIVKRAVVVGEKIEVRPMMYLALSYDHRLIDGKEAVTFLVRIKQLLEDPTLLGRLS